MFAPGVVADGNSPVLQVKIPSMDCAACAVSIQRKLRQQTGVVVANVSYGTKKAFVQYDTAKLTPEKIIATIDESGSKAEPDDKP
jgi:copper chaperone CopZ